MVATCPPVMPPPWAPPVALVGGAQTPEKMENMHFQPLFQVFCFIFVELTSDCRTLLFLSMKL